MVGAAWEWLLPGLMMMQSPVWEWGEKASCYTMKGSGGEVVACTSRANTVASSPSNLIGRQLRCAQVQKEGFLNVLSNVFRKKWSCASCR